MTTKTQVVNQSGKKMFLGITGSGPSRSWYDTTKGYFRVKDVKIYYGSSMPSSVGSSYSSVDWDISKPFDWYHFPAYVADSYNDFDVGSEIKESACYIVVTYSNVIPSDMSVEPRIKIWLLPTSELPSNPSILPKDKPYISYRKG